ncbi:MAG: outer membrane protein assembly factor BamA, partial [Bacteroidota bacterium]
NHKNTLLLKLNFELLRYRLTKISLFIVILLFIFSCDVTKRVPDSKRLLTKNEILIDEKPIHDEVVYFQLYQKPNTSILGYRLRLQLYNLAKQHSDSLYKQWLDRKPNRRARLNRLLSAKQVERLGKSFVVSGLSNFLMKTGEAPSIFDSTAVKKSIKRLNAYYYNKGYFDVVTTLEKDTSFAKKIQIKYKVNRKTPYMIDSLKTAISSPLLDSLYRIHTNRTLIKTGKQYDTELLNGERDRITNEFRNNGAFYFQQNFIRYSLDTIGTSKKVNVNLIIKDNSFRKNDSTITAPFRLYTINKVAIYTDQTTSKNEIKVKDSLIYNDFILYSEKKLKYRPKAITDAVLITKGSLFSDNNTTLTTKYLSNLRVFKYPTIQYIEDPKDPNGLIANIYLTPRKKYTFGASVDFTHSNIQDFGISGNTSLGIRNVFNGAETFEIGFRGNVGASKDLANPNNTFFNISEIGLDAKLNFPRLFFPFNTEKIIPKTMLPTTTISMGYAKQQNIGLDKQNFTGSFTYNWIPRKNQNIRLDLFNIQFVKNLNISNYFNVYKSSFNALNNLAIYYDADTNFPQYFSNGQLIIDSGTNGFVNAVLGSNPTITPTADDLKTIRSIEERRKRLTENNLIFASNISYYKTTSRGVNDNNFYSIRTKFESAGNLLSLLARASKQLQSQSGANTFFEVQFSQYLKGEFEFIKHWTLQGKTVIAVRTFAGLAVPYGNSNTIPFSRSYFSGGSNDNRAWQPYSLGPGSSGGINDFNEANMKLSANAEFRCNLFGKFNGALFADLGNIWNVFDAVDQTAYQFKGWKSMKEMALGTGFGLRYDQGLFVVRFDVGFKTYNPSEQIENKWLREFNLAKSVLNIGINYPF